MFENKLNTFLKNTIYIELMEKSGDQKMAQSVNAYCTGMRT